MIKKIIIPLFRLSNKFSITRNCQLYRMKKAFLGSPVLYNYSKIMKKTTSKVNKSCASQQVNELYKKVGWSNTFKQQYMKLISKYTSNGDFPNLIKLKEFRVRKDQQHNDQNNQSHLLELYELAALHQAQKRPEQIEFYFKKINDLLKKFPGLIQINQLNEIIQYLIGKHLFGQTIDRRTQAKQWYQIFKQKVDMNAVPSINDDLKFYFHFQLAVIYLDLKMFQQSKEQFNKFCEILERGKIQIDQHVRLIALYQFAEAQIERGEKKHALQVIDVLLSKINFSNKDEIQYLEKSQQLIEDFGKSSERAEELKLKIQTLKQKFEQKKKPISSSLPSSKPKKSPIIPNIKQVEALWNNFSQDYNKFDYCPQTLYYSFLYMLQIWEGKNILQVACGTGKLLPLAINMKEKHANYLAVDLSPQMIQLTRKNLKRNLELYDSKLSFEQWMSKNNIDIMVANGEEPISKPERFNKKFDRIICNCCLMLTSDAEKMLKNLHEQAQEGCLLGVSVWGDKNNNNLMTSIRQSYLESKVQLPEQRSNFHLYKKVSALAQKCGWQTLISWEQNALFPALSADSEKYNSFFFHQVEKIQQSKRQEVKKVLLSKLAKYFKQDKKGLNFSCQMIILRKK